MYIVDYNLLGFNTLKSLDKSIKIPLYEGGHDMYPLYWTSDNAVVSFPFTVNSDKIIKININ